jgi:hypothetical protein
MTGTCNISNPNQDFTIAMENFNHAYEFYIKNKTNTAAINNLENAHNNLTSTINCYLTGVNETNKYNEATYGQIITEYNAIRTKRADLDMKLREIYNLNDTIPREEQNMVDSSILATTLCAFLATTIIYFIFVN